MAEIRAWMPALPAADAAPATVPELAAATDWQPASAPAALKS
jgi:hypothetical protein